ncbi:MAG TPA: phage holin family protein [Burkholderiaceae bacterium]|nr:phage holin family protein [Burkholderiaceae bacterium]
MAAESDRPAGLVASLRSLLAHALSLLLTRGELAALELATARDRAVRWLVLGLISAVLLLAALLTASLWVAAIFWDGPRALALGLLAAAYAVAGVIAIIVIRSEIAAAPPILSETRAELEKDRDALRGRTHGAGHGEG